MKKFRVRQFLFTCMISQLFILGTLLWNAPVVQAQASQSAEIRVWPYMPSPEGQGSNSVLLDHWTTGATLTLSIDDPTNGTGWDYIDSKVYMPLSKYCYIDALDCFQVDPTVFVIESGQRVRVTDGVQTIEYTVSDLGFLWLDYDTDTIGGKADPGSQVIVYAERCNDSDMYAFRHSLVANSGLWDADFTHPGYGVDERSLYDIYEGSDMIIIQQVDGNAGTEFMLFRPERTGKGSIQGTVRDTEGNPLVNIDICAPEGQHGITVANGSYAIYFVPAGEYTLGTCSEGDYLNEYFGAVPGGDQASVIIVTDKHPVTGIDFKLSLAGWIMGVVHDEEGSAITNAEVLATDTKTKVIFGNYTDENGNYRIGAVPARDYYVMVYKSGLAYQIYDNSYESTMAKPVHVDVGEETTGIDFSISSPGQISGKIYDSGGNPVSNARVCISTFDHDELLGCTGEYLYQLDGSVVSESDSEGSFITALLPRGDYKVSASASGFATSYYPNYHFIDQAGKVTVVSGTTTKGIDVLLEQYGNIMGNVRDVESTPMAGVIVVAFIPGLYSSNPITTDSNGDYLIESLPSGTYDVSFEIDGWQSEVSKDANGKDVSINMGVLVKAGETVSGIDVVMLPIQEEISETTSANTNANTTLYFNSNQGNLIWYFITGGGMGLLLIAVAVYFGLRKKNKK
jgi:hypothetical protein